MKQQTKCSKTTASIFRKIMKMFLMIIFMGLFFSQGVHAQNAPTVIKAQLINSQDIEIYWSEDVDGAGWVESKYVNNKIVMQEQNYSITVNGKDNPIHYYCWQEYNSEDKGIVYYNTRNDFYPKNPDNHKTTIRLSEPVTNLTNIPEIKVTIKGNKIKSKSGVFVPEQTITVSDYEPFYQKEITLECGVKILGTAHVRQEAMTTAEAMLNVILANQDIAERMGDAGCMMGIYGEGEIAYDIPEHRFTYDEDYLYVEGFGGTQLASIKDANVLRLKTGNYTTGYPNESILTHEFAHTVHTFGLSEEQQQELFDIYEAARKAGKWENSYAGSNEYEYFATLSAMWFNAMDDTADGKWDGVRGPINTRAELKAYDKAAYDFLSAIYVSDQYLPSPWNNGTVPDNNTYPGTEIDKDPGTDKNPGTGTDKNPGTGTDKNPGTETDKNPGTGQVAQPDTKNYTVTFVYNNGTSNITKTVKEGEKVTGQPIPERKNYIFKGWYLGTDKYDFSSNVTGNLTLKAEWEKVTVKKASFGSLKPLKGKKVLVKIKAMKGVQGYKIMYSKNAKFKKQVKMKYAKTNKITIKNLKKGTWYFKVQAYRMDSKGNKVLGKAGKVKKINVTR